MSDANPSSIYPEYCETRPAQKTAWKPMAGQHCETTMLVNLLSSRGILLSEPMAFGLGEGIDFQYIQSPFSVTVSPMITGRIDALEITRLTCNALGVPLHEMQPADPTEGYEDLVRLVNQGTIVGVTVDIYYLDHFSSASHFSAHCLTVCQLDDKQALIVDTEQQGGLQPLAIRSLQAARSSNLGFQPSPLKLMYVEADAAPIGDDEIVARAWHAAHSTATRMLADCHPNRGVFGMRMVAEKWASWPAEQVKIGRHIPKIARFWRYAGTGGANFRKLYVEFLSELASRSRCKALTPVIHQFETIRKQWDCAIDLLLDDFDTSNPSIGARLLADSLTDLARTEETAFEILRNVAKDQMEMHDPQRQYGSRRRGSDLVKLTHRSSFACRVPETDEFQDSNPTRQYDAMQRHIRD